MGTVTIPDLRNHGGKIVDRVEAGETLTVTRAGKPVAELTRIKRPKLTSEEFFARWRHLEPVDPVKFRADVDKLFDTTIF